MNSRAATAPVARGFTLMELMLVMAIASIIASVAVMSAEPIRMMALDAAVNEVVQAMNYARSEAARMGAPRVVNIDISNHLVSVAQLAYGSTTPIIDTSNPVLHPLDKNNYAETINGLPFLPFAVSVTAAFKFANNTTSSTLAFAADGTPCTVVGPGPNTVSALSTAGMPQITLTSGNGSRSITVEPVSGRVTWQ